jgi:hypothetical protein
MTFPTTYANLQIALAEFSHQDNLTANMPDFIALAEQTILRELKLRVNEAVVTGVTAGAAIALPAGLGSIERLEIVSNNVRYVLDYVAPGIEDTTLGLSRKYTVQNGAIRLIPPPASSYAYTLNYIPNLAPLSGTNPTNWALTNAPDVYLYGSMCQLARHTLDDDSFARYSPMFQAALDAVKRADEGRRLPISGSLQIKPRGYR